jgi:hypothetical protein
MLSWNHAHDWVVQRCYHELSCVTIRFERGMPSLDELRAVRRCLPQFRDTPPGELRTTIGAMGALHLERMPTGESLRLAEAARLAGLNVVTDNASFLSYLPYNRTTGCAWLIEDDTEAQAVAEAMISTGVPVQDVEA